MVQENPFQEVGEKPNVVVWLSLLTKIGKLKVPRSAKTSAKAAELDCQGKRQVSRLCTVNTILVLEGCLGVNKIGHWISTPETGPQNGFQL